MSYMKEHMLDRVYKLGEKAGLTPNDAEDIYLNICDGDFEEYCDCIDIYRELKAFLIRLGEKPGLTSDEIEDIYLNACDGKCGAYCRLIDTYRELKAYLIQAYTESMACEKDI